MDAITRTKDQAGTHSHVVRPANMEWQKTRFPGCEVKTLLFDAESGLVTALMRFAPGAVLPDHEHVKIEQTYVLEGKLVDKEGPAEGLEVNPGEFVWREAGSRHVACTPEGGLMLAMFQIPNKFHERDGRTTDLGGAGLGKHLGPRAQGLIPFVCVASAACTLDARSRPRGRGEMVDARDLKSLGGNPVRVQVPPSAPSRPLLGFH